MYGRILYYGDWLKHITGTDKWQERKVGGGAGVRGGRAGGGATEETRLLRNKRGEGLCAAADSNPRRRPPEPPQRVWREARKKGKKKNPLLFHNCLTRCGGLGLKCITVAVAHSPAPSSSDAPGLQPLTPPPFCSHLLTYLEPSDQWLTSG